MRGQLQLRLLRWHATLLAMNVQLYKIGWLGLLLYELFASLIMALRMQLALNCGHLLCCGTLYSTNHCDSFNILIEKYSKMFGHWQFVYYDTFAIPQQCLNM